MALLGNSWIAQAPLPPTTHLPSCFNTALPSVGQNPIEITITTLNWNHLLAHPSAPPGDWSPGRPRPSKLVPSYVKQGAGYARTCTEWYRIHEGMQLTWLMHILLYEGCLSTTGTCWKCSTLGAPPPMPSTHLGESFNPRHVPFFPPGPLDTQQEPV